MYMSLEDSLSYLGVKSLAEFTKLQGLDGVDLRDPQDCRAVRLAVFREAQALRDYLERELPAVDSRLIQ